MLNLFNVLLRTILNYENKNVFVKFCDDPIIKVEYSIVIDSECNVTVYNNVLEFSQFKQKMTDFNLFEKLLIEVSALFSGNENESGNSNESESRIKYYISAIENTLTQIHDCLPEEERKAVLFLIEQMLSSFLYKRKKND